MFVELHYQGRLYSFNVEKINRYFPSRNKTLIFVDSTMGQERFLVDEDYETVKQAIKVSDGGKAEDK